MNKKFGIIALFMLVACGGYPSSPSSNDASVPVCYLSGTVCTEAPNGCCSGICRYDMTDDGGVQIWVCVEH